MAVVCFSNANTFLTSLPSSHSSSSSSLTTLTSIFGHKHNARRPASICKAVTGSLVSSSSPISTRRSLSVSLTTTFLFTLAAKSYFDANAAILEADGDEGLLEKVKRDRKKRLERQGVINSSNKETAYLQDLVYKLSKVGQAIENNDLSTESSVLGKSIDTDWVQKANLAITKLSSSPEEKSQVDIRFKDLSFTW